MIAAYVFHVQYTATRNHEGQLTFVPTGMYREHFATEIERCGIDHRNIAIGYIDGVRRAEYLRAITQSKN